MATATIGGIGYGLYNWYAQPELDNAEYFQTKFNTDESDIIEKKTDNQDKKDRLQKHLAPLREPLPENQDNSVQLEHLDILEDSDLPKTPPTTTTQFNTKLELVIEKSTQKPAKKYLLDNHANMFRQRQDSEEQLDELAIPQIPTEIKNNTNLTPVDETDVNKKLGIVELNSDDITDLKKFEDQETKTFPSWTVFKIDDSNAATTSPKIELVETIISDDIDWSDSDDDLNNSQDLTKSMLFDATKSFLATARTLNNYFTLPNQAPKNLTDHLENSTAESFSETLTENVCTTIERIKGKTSSLEISNEQSAIKRGGTYAYQIFIKNNFDDIPTKNLAEYQRSISDLQSFFYSLSFQKRFDGFGFEEGTFFIEDPSGKLKQFLLGYLDAVKNDGHNLGDPEGNHWFAHNPFAYYRANSHNFPKSFGIDLRSNNGASIYWMDKFGHILIGFTPTGVWLKPEKSGCSYGDVSSHAVHLVEAQASKKAKKLFDGIEYFTGYKVMEFEGDDSPLYNKERIATEVIKAFSKLFPEAQTATKGIGTMYAYAVNKLNTGKVQPDTIAQVQQFITNLQQTYSKVNERQGSEIYISQEDMIFAWAHAVGDHNKTVSNFVSSVFAPLAYELTLYRARTQSHGAEQDPELQTSLRQKIDNLITCAPIIIKKSTDETLQNYLKQTLAVCSYLVSLNDDQFLQEIGHNSILETEYQAKQLRKILAQPLADIITVFEDQVPKLFDQFAATPEQMDGTIEQHNKDAKKSAKNLKNTIQQFTTRGLTQFQNGSIQPSQMGCNFISEISNHADTIDHNQLTDYLAACTQVEQLWKKACTDLICTAHTYGMFTHESPSVKKIKNEYHTQLTALVNTIAHAWSNKVSDISNVCYQNETIYNKIHSAEESIRELISIKHKAEEHLHTAFKHDYIEPFSTLWYFAPTVAAYHAMLNKNFTTTKQSIDIVYENAESITNMNVPEKSQDPRHIAYKNFQKKYQSLNEQVYAIAEQQNSTQ